MNKSLLTNLVAGGLVVLGLVTPVGREAVLMAGLFALSGALTNWLAIYMLFERVPGLYGSGVIPARFEDFKHGIHELIMEQFFTQENVERLLADEGAQLVDFDVERVKEAIDFEQIFGRVEDAVLASPLGGMLSMFGGKSAMAPVRAPVEKALRDVVGEILASDRVRVALAAGITGPGPAHDVVEKVDRIVRARLNELTPDDVKRIVQEMIRRHLGWLVVWGGVFGAVIGLLCAVLGA